MAGEQDKAPQRAPHDDSSPVVLHARQTAFVMLIVSALVVVGVLAENSEGLNRALLEARTVVGLWKLSKSELAGHESISLPRIIAGTAPTRSDTQNAFMVALSPVNGGSGTDNIVCTIDVDMNEYHLVSNRGPVRYIRVVPRGSLGGEGVTSPANQHDNGLWKRSLDYWYTRRPPRDLVEFSRLWDILASSGQRALITADRMRSHIGRGLMVTEGTLYELYYTFLPDNKKSIGVQELGFASLEDYKRRSHKEVFYSNGKPTNSFDWEMEKRLKMWRDDGYDTVAAGVCLDDHEEPNEKYLFVFPVKLDESQFDWTVEWVEHAVHQAFLSEDDLPIARSGTKRLFTDVFTNLADGMADLRTRELSTLPGLLQNRLEKPGSNIEVAGIAMPGNLLRSLGLFLILIIQGYAARHVAEAASRMKSSASGDPGAFQAWIMLYDGWLSRFASYCIVAAPAGAAATLFFLASDGPLIANSVVSWLAFLASLGLAAYSFQNAWRLHDAARRHRAA